MGAPEIRVVLSETAHITVKKALRILGFGMNRLHYAAVDAHGRIDPARLPALDARTLLILQAGEVNTGEFDHFAELIPRAREAGAWVHVDGAFGLWARASSSAHLAEGVELADSWTSDGHKWLNTPYDSAMAICRDADALAAAMNSDAAYATASKDAQKNLTLEFSRRARGVAIWAALASLGRDGLCEMIDRHIRQAGELAEALRAQGFSFYDWGDRALWTRAQALVVGHALLEKLLAPRKPLCAHVLFVADVEAPTLPAALKPADLPPLPVLGIPGWHAGAQDAGFYANADYFRPSRRAPSVWAA